MRAAHRRRRAAVGGASPASQDKRGLARGLELRRLVSTHGLPVISISDLVAHRLKRERLCVYGRRPEGQAFGLLHRVGVEIVERIGLTGVATPLRAVGG